jgi:hypothetical protein
MRVVVVLRHNGGMGPARTSLLSVLVVTACGPGASSSDGDGSGTGATSTVTTATSATDSADGSDGVPGCPAFADEASPGPIAIEITNLRAEAAWLPMGAGCIDPVPWVLTGPDGADVSWRAPACGTCEGAVQGQCPCPPPFCEEATALYLEAGATVRYDWSGLVHVPEEVPQACPGIDDCGQTCERAVVAPAGDYAFAIEVGGAEGCATEPCACPPIDGSCTLYDPGMSFTGLVGLEGALVLPGGSMVQIAIR